MKKKTLNSIVGYTAILASVSTVIMMIIAISSLKSSISQFEKSNDNANEQIKLIQQQIEDNRILSYSQIPANITIEPKYMVHSDSGKFKVNLINNNLFDLYSVGVTKNCFVGRWNDNKPIHIATSITSTIPNILVDTLSSNGKHEMVINIDELNDRIDTFENQENHFIKLLKIKVVYQRSVDRKEFSTNKLYLVTETELIDFDDENVVKFGGLTFNEIKNHLGVVD